MKAEELQAFLERQGFVFPDWNAEGRLPATMELLRRRTPYKPDGRHVQSRMIGISMDHKESALIGRAELQEMCGTLRPVKDLPLVLLELEQRIQPHHRGARARYARALILAQLELGR